MENIFVLIKKLGRIRFSHFVSALLVLLCLRLGRLCRKLVSKLSGEQTIQIVKYSELWLDLWP